MFCVKKYNNYLNCKNFIIDGSYGDVDEVFLNEEYGYLLRINYKFFGVIYQFIVLESGINKGCNLKFGYSQSKLKDIFFFFL